VSIKNKSRPANFIIETPTSTSHAVNVNVEAFATGVKNVQRDVQELANLGVILWLYPIDKTTLQLRDIRILISTAFGSSILSTLYPAKEPPSKAV